jgi:hypothetical protein
VARPSPDPIRAAFDSIGAHFDRRERGSQWVRESDGIVQRLFLERSRWGPSYHLDLLIDLSNALPEPPPLEATIQGRVGNLLSAEEETRLLVLLDLESHLDDPEREEELTRLMSGPLLARLDSLRTFEDLQAAFDSGELRGLILTWTARSAFDPTFVPSADG